MDSAQSSGRGGNRRRKMRWWILSHSWRYIARRSWGIVTGCPVQWWRPRTRADSAGAVRRPDRENHVVFRRRDAVSAVRPRVDTAGVRGTGGGSRELDVISKYNSEVFMHSTN